MEPINVRVQETSLITISVYVSMIRVISLMFQKSLNSKGNNSKVHFFKGSENRDFHGLGCFPAPPDIISIVFGAQPRKSNVHNMVRSTLLCLLMLGGPPG